MKWRKKGVVHLPDGSFSWNRSHAQVPLADFVDGKRLRIYFGTRDKDNRTYTTFIEVVPDNPQKILYVHDKPVLLPGKLGCFDDSGAMPSWIVDHDGAKYLYYTGWNTGRTVPYRNSIGVAKSVDGGISFKREYEGPILDRTFREPHFCAQPCVMIEKNIWRMWYSSTVTWKIHRGKPEPIYHIKYAESTDGIEWARNGVVCVDFKSPDEAGLVRPSILKENGIYKMWYCFRNLDNYREDKNNSYRIGYAESATGVEWERKDDEAGIDVSEHGWDSEMIAYPFVYSMSRTKYMLYNGNGFGKTGFGCAVFE